MAKASSKEAVEFLNGRSNGGHAPPHREVGPATRLRLVLLHLGAAAGWGPMPGAVEAAIRAVGDLQNRNRSYMLDPLIDAVATVGRSAALGQSRRSADPLMPPLGGWGTLMTTTWDTKFGRVRRAEPWAQSVFGCSTSSYRSGDDRGARALDEDQLTPDP